MAEHKQVNGESTLEHGAGQGVEPTPDTAADIRRLRWQCRRGMLELDHLLDRFLDLGYADLDGRDRAVFERLLGEQDQRLSDWFMSRAEPPDREVGRLVARIIQVVRTPHPALRSP